INFEQVAEDDQYDQQAFNITDFQIFFACHFISPQAFFVSYTLCVSGSVWLMSFCRCSTSIFSISCIVTPHYLKLSGKVIPYPSLVILTQINSYYSLTHASQIKKEKSSW